MGVFSDMLEKYTSPWRLILGRGTDRDKEIQEQEVNKALDAIIKTTQPFRMGANVLTQGYGPAFRALTGGDPNRPSVVENFIREGVTPQEQKLIEEKPYMTALKSSAGMASTLMPFASRVAPASTLLARTGQIAGRGALEGLTGGFGYSREGKELQDTLIGGAIGMGSELLGNYIFDPNYRNMVNAQLDEGIPGKYSGALRLSDDLPLDEKLMDDRTLGEAIADDQAHLARLKGQGYEEGKEYLYLNDRPEPQPKTQRVKEGPTYNDQSDDIRKSLRDTYKPLLDENGNLLLDPIESFTQKWGSLEGKDMKPFEVKIKQGGDKLLNAESEWIMQTFEKMSPDKKVRALERIDEIIELIKDPGQKSQVEFLKKYLVK